MKILERIKHKWKTQNNLQKSSNKGFTLIEMLTAVGIMAAFLGLVVVTLTVVAQAQMRDLAQDVKDDFEYARNYSRTHGSNAKFKLTKTDTGVTIIISSEVMGIEDVESYKECEDRNLKVFYKVTGDKKNYELGSDANEHASVEDKTLEMEFAQTTGAIIGKQYLDYIVLSNGSKNYKLFIKQSTGMMYYDYEIEDEDFDENIIKNDDPIIVSRPYFVTESSPESIVADVEKKYDKDGNAIAVQPTLNYDARYIKIGGVYRAKEVGEYQITFSLKDPYSMQWETGGVDDIVLTWVIFG